YRQSKHVRSKSRRGGSVRGADRPARRPRWPAERRVHPSPCGVGDRGAAGRCGCAPQADPAVASGVTFRLVPGLSARDRAATLAVLENAQWVYALGLYPKKQVLDDDIDVKMLRDRIGAMRKAAQADETKDAGKDWWQESSSPTMTG